MRQQTHLALGHWERPGVWEMTCSTCYTVMGTIGSIALVKAIRANSERGGIMCPGCRKIACYYCGLFDPQTEMKEYKIMLFDRGTVANKFQSESDWVKVCKMCYCDNYEQILSEPRSSPACPVVHNSTAVRNNE